MTESEKKLLNRQRAAAVKKAWQRERELILQGMGTVDWTPAQQKEILETGRVEGYEGQHMKSCVKFPEYAAWEENIQFLTHQQHLAAHNSGCGKHGYRSPTNGYFDPQTGKMHSFGSNPPRKPKRVKLSRLCKDIRNIKTNTVTKEDIAKKYNFRIAKSTKAESKRQAKSLNGNGDGTMGAKVVEQNYANMIAGLKNFGVEIREGLSQLSSVANTCITGLGEGDEAASGITKQINEAAKLYTAAALYAMDIASQMQQELEHIRKERAAWSDKD